MIGGHQVENETGASLNNALFYHSKDRQWQEAFTLGNGDFRDVDCCVISAPVTNRDLRPMRYKDCKWVMW